MEIVRGSSDSPRAYNLSRSVVNLVVSVPMNVDVAGTVESLSLRVCELWGWHELTRTVKH